MCTLPGVDQPKQCSHATKICKPLSSMSLRRGSISCQQIRKNLPILIMNRSKPHPNQKFYWRFRERSSTKSGMAPIFLTLKKMLRSLSLTFDCCQSSYHLSLSSNIYKQSEISRPGRIPKSPLAWGCLIKRNHTAQPRGALAFIISYTLHYIPHHLTYNRIFLGQAFPE